MLKQINNVKVGAVQLGDGQEKKPVRGADLFPEPYANMFLLAKKKSGKSTLIFKILKKCASKKTKLVFIVSTVKKDALYKKMTAYFEDRGNEVIIHTDLKEGKQSVIDDILLEDEEPEEESDEEPEEKEAPPPPADFIDFGEEQTVVNEAGEKVNRKPRKPRKDKYTSPEIIFILDDQGTALRDKSVSNLLKKNRHYKSKVIIASQYLNDLKPEAIKQLDYIIMFGGQSEDKLKLVHRHADLALPLDKFIDIYKQATAARFNFLYIDTTHEEFRKNFNEQFQLD